MTSTLKIGEPARVGIWGLTVDNMAAPVEYVLVRYLTEGRRHSEPFERVTRFRYAAATDQESRSESVRLLGEVGVPESDAIELLTQVAFKLISPKAATADIGFRPVT